MEHVVTGCVGGSGLCCSRRLRRLVGDASGISRSASGGMADGHAVDADLAQSVFNLVQFEWFDNRLDFLHLTFSLFFLIDYSQNASAAVAFDSKQCFCNRARAVPILGIDTLLIITA